MRTEIFKDGIYNVNIDLDDVGVFEKSFSTIATINYPATNIATTNYPTTTFADMKVEEKMKTFKIVDYKTYDNKVVIVTFEDGTKEKAVCCGDDKFDFERGVEVCVLKHILGKDNYNAMLKTAMRQISDINEANEKKKKEEETAARKKQKHLERKRKTIEARRKRRISEMKEAYLGAMKEYTTEYTAYLDTTLDTMCEKCCNCDNEKWDEIYK